MIHQQNPLHDAKNYQKQRRIVACIHEEVANKRNDYLHKVSIETIEIEDLRASNMKKNQSLAKAISEVSWLQFHTMFESKEKWYGKTVMAVVKRISYYVNGCVQHAIRTVTETITQVSILKKKL